jgi:hypothetical protein
MQLTALFVTKNKGSTTATNRIHSLISLKSIYFSCLMIHITKENKHDNTKITKKQDNEHTNRDHIKNDYQM